MSDDYDSGDLNSDGPEPGLLSVVPFWALVLVLIIWAVVEHT